MAVNFQLTIDDTSPIIIYSPLEENTTTPSLLAGWVPSYSISGSPATLGQLGNGSSQHLTSFDGATLSITWSGPGIQLYGDVTQASYEAILDGQAVSNPNPSASNDANLLVAFDGLSDGEHNITLVAHTQPTSSSFVLFDRAVITASVDVISANLSSQLIEDSTISFQGQWSFECDLVVDSCFHVSNHTGDVSSLNFTGTAVSVLGLRDFTFGRYNVTLDGETFQYDAKSSWKEKSMLFLKTGLDPETSHVLIITNAENHSLAVGTINVTSVSGVVVDSSNNGFPKGTIAALVLGILLGLLVISGLAFLFWRRRRARITFVEPSIHKTQIMDVIDIRSEDDDDHKGFPTHPNNHFSLKFASSPTVPFQGQPKPTPLNIPRSPTPSLSSRSQHLHDTDRGSLLYHTESASSGPYLSVNVRTPPKVKLQSAPWGERRNSVRPVGPRERPTQDREDPPSQQIPEVHVMPTSSRTNTFSFLDLNSSPSSSVVREPSRNSQQSQSQPLPHSCSQSRISGSSSAASQDPKRNSEQSHSSAGLLSLSTALQHPSARVGSAAIHPYSKPTSPHLVIPSSHAAIQETSPTESAPVTVSDIQFRDMNVSEHDTSRRTSGSHPGWQHSLSPATKQDFASTTIVQKLFGARHAQALEQRRTGHRRSFTTSVLLPKPQDL